MFFLDLSREERLLVFASVKGCICFNSENHKVQSDDSVYCTKCKSTIVNKSDSQLIV